VQEDLGNMGERVNYAKQVVSWVAGYTEPDLNYVYLPLVMGGLLVDRIVRTGSRENPWELVDGLREASAGRQRLVDTDETMIIFRMLNKLLNEVAQELQNRRIARPT
jgi:hypothetical protein